jgi:histidine ammonia-lyase
VLRRGDVPAVELAGACGWPQDVARAERIAAALVGEGFAEWRGNVSRVLCLR